MKRILLVLLLLFSLLLFSCSYRFSKDCLRYSSGSEECITDFGLRVFQVLDANHAFCKVLKQIDDAGHVAMTNMVVLLYDPQCNNFYNNQDIIIPEGKGAMKIGVYDYKRTFKNLRVFPVVEIR